ncbi:hypothetical protein AB7M17_002966 [Bradyrhizobium sp. USDA 377]
MRERRYTAGPALAHRIEAAKTGNLSRMAVTKQLVTVWEAAMNTPECYTFMVTCVSCLTIIGLMAVGAW